MEKKNKHIAFEKKDNVATITLDRPPVNVLNIEMMREINDVLRGLRSDCELKAVVFRANGKAFSAGVDVSEHTADKVQEMIEVFHEIFRLLNSIAAPSVAVVDGAALGGGCELATFCDIVLASEKAKFGQPEIKVGVFAPVASAIFPWLVGRNRALELLLTGESIDAREAERIGLINKALTVDEFDAKVSEFLGMLKEKSAVVLQIAKKSVDAGLYISVGAALGKIEEIYLNKLMKTEDATEGLKAFLEKRPPVWKNK
ncbi:MAG: enoyl-CoA hydratase/isomerase family protein [Candidatus Eiseniibacteriota bacterium]|nr:MAG: enoyl-CoA hydratase/isomerase family protein [Candidatus Eisenbacteria bacterium]